jgi:hypothetical protein
MAGHCLDLERQPASSDPAMVNGTADSLEAAKAEFKAAWERFYADLTPERIRRWHLIEDMGKSSDWWLE